MSLTLFGLTGGIACGKSTVAKFFRDRGVPVIDADTVAREVVAPGTHGLERIVHTFGANLLNPDGSLNRSKTADIVFADDKARNQLEAIIHPAIQGRTQQLADELARQGHPLAAYEAALIVEKGHANRFRPLVVVVVDEPTQILRLMSRDGLQEQQAKARLASQMPIAEKALVADHLIDTGVSLEAVRERTDQVLNKIRESLVLG